MFNFGFKSRNNALPRANLIVKIPAFYPFVDRIGKHDGPAQLRQFIRGPVELLSASISGAEWVISKQGDATVAISAGKISVGDGDLWSLRLSNGSQYEFAGAISPTKILVHDISIYKRYLLATVSDSSLVCVKTREKGSEVADISGYSYRENLLNYQSLDPSTKLTATSVGDGYYSYVKKDTSSGGTAYGYTQSTSLHPTTKSTSYIARLYLRKLAGSLTSSISVGFFNGDWTGLSVNKISGPGIVTKPLWVDISGLTENEDTIVDIVRSNYVIGATAPVLNLYPTSVSTPSTRIGDGVVCKAQICAGNVTREYTDQPSCNLTVQPALIPGNPNPIGKVVFFGDSLAGGLSSTVSGFYPGTTFIDASYPGYTTSALLPYFEADVIGSGADVVIIIAGTNDAYGTIDPSDTRSNILSMVSAARASGVRCIVASLTPSQSHTGWSTDVQSRIDAHNTWAATVGSVDVFSALRATPTSNYLHPAYDGGDQLHLSDSFGKQAMAVALAMALPVSYTQTDVYYAPLQYQGPPRNNITRLTGTSATINPTDTYQFDDTNGWRVVTGWTAGTANDFFDADGVPIPFSGQQLIDAGIGPRFYCGLKGIAGYTVDQDASANAKIIRILKVPTYIDTLYWSDHQELNWEPASGE